MPLILAPGQYDAWLDAKKQDGAAVLKQIIPELDGELEAEPVSAYVNNPRHEGPECIERVKEEK
jgi:putative SOS response-associated peptidase YedK